MARQITWETSMNGAISKASSKDIPILLDFFNPG